MTTTARWLAFLAVVLFTVAALGWAWYVAGLSS